MKTDKTINVKLVIADKDYKTIYECPVEMSTANPKEYYIKATLDFTKPDLTNIDKENLPEDVVKELAKYIMGKLSVKVTNGVFAEGGKYAQIKLNCTNLELGILLDINKNTRYYPMLLITSPEEDVFRLLRWAEDGRLSTNSMANPDTFTKGSADHSMGDWCTSGEAVVIGAYITTDQDLSKDENENVILKQNKDIVIGEYAKFSSYGGGHTEQQHHRRVHREKP